MSHGEHHATVDSNFAGGGIPRKSLEFRVPAIWKNAVGAEPCAPLRLGTGQLQRKENKVRGEPEFRRRSPPTLMHTDNAGNNGTNVYHSS